MLVLLLELDVLNEVVRWVLQDNQLMGDDTIQNFLLLVLGDVVNETGLMELSLAALVTFLTVQDLVDVYLFATAVVLVAGAKWAEQVHFDLGRGLVLTTVSHLGNWVVILTAFALDQV